MYLNGKEAPNFQWMECIRAGSNLQKKAAKSFIIQHMAASYRPKPLKQKHCPSPRVDKMAWGVCDLPFLHFSLVVLFDQSDDGCLLTSSFCFLAYLARADICEQTRENRSSVLFSHLVVSTLCNLVNRSMPGLPVHQQLPEFTQTHVHWIGDTIQPSHPLSSPSPQSFPESGSFQMSQLFTSGGQNIGVSASTSVLPMNTQD